MLVARIARVLRHAARGAVVAVMLVAGTSLAEAGTPDHVVRGLLEEPAMKTGLESAEVSRQITTGIDHGRRKGGAA